MNISDNLPEQSSIVAQVSCAIPLGQKMALVPAREHWRE